MASFVDIIEKVREYGGIIREPKMKDGTFLYSFNISMLSKVKQKEIYDLIKKNNGK